MVVKGVVEGEECSLKHKREASHDEIKIPGDNAVHLPLSMAAAIDKESGHSNLGITVEPLLASIATNAVRREVIKLEQRIDGCEPW